MRISDIRHLSALIVALGMIFGPTTGPVAVHADGTGWQASVGAQRGDKAIQALAFLPGELTVNVGDTVAWTFGTGEPHTVTLGLPFGTSNTTPQECNGVNSSTGTCTWNGSSPANSGRMQDGETFAITFGSAVAPGNYALICLIHQRMTGTVHVQAASSSYPHDQGFYNRQAQQESNQLIQQGNQLEARERAGAVGGPGHASITIGDGFFTTSGPVSESVSINRYLPGQLTVHVGNTVNWTADDVTTPHTVTFGVEPLGNPNTPVNVSGSPESAVLNTPYPQLFVGPSVSSGFLGDSHPGWHGGSFLVTFNAVGTYQYYCMLHDELGMVGTVNVVP